MHFLIVLKLFRVFYLELNGIGVGSNDFLFGELNMGLAVIGMGRSTQVILGTAVGFAITFNGRWLLGRFLLLWIFAITVLFTFQNKHDKLATFATYFHSTNWLNEAQFIQNKYKRCAFFLPFCPCLLSWWCSSSCCRTIFRSIGVSRRVPPHRFCHCVVADWRKSMSRAKWRKPLWWSDKFEDPFCCGRE